MTQREDLPYLIVDGYNVIGQSEQHKLAFERDPDVARAYLVDDVASYAAGRYEALIVFDAHGNPGSDGAPHDVAGLTVVFSPAGVEADSVIEQCALELSGSGRRVVVATSDSATRHAVSRPGVSVQSAGAFASTLTSAAEEEADLGDERVRARIEDLVDEETRRRLSEWARGG